MTEPKIKSNGIIIIAVNNEEPLFPIGRLLQEQCESCIFTQMWISVITRPWILVSCKKQIWVSAYHSLIAVRASKLERGLKTISEYAPDMRIHFIYLCSLKSNMVYNYCICKYIYRMRSPCFIEDDLSCRENLKVAFLRKCGFLSSHALGS